MAEFTLDYTGAQINTLLSKINSVETLANTTSTQVSTNTTNISTNTTNISSLESGKQDAIAYETTTFTVKGATVNLYKWGRLVRLRANANITSAWDTGEANAVSSGLADKWLPTANAFTINLGFEATSAKWFIFTTAGALYHSTGSSMASGNRMRIDMCYISKA